MRRRELTPQERLELSSGPNYVVEEPRSRWLPWVVIPAIALAALILDVVLG